MKYLRKLFESIHDKSDFVDEILLELKDGGVDYRVEKGFYYTKTKNFDEIDLNDKSVFKRVMDRHNIKLGSNGIPTDNNPGQRMGMYRYYKITWSGKSIPCYRIHIVKSDREGNEYVQNYHRIEKFDHDITRRIEGRCRLNGIGFVNDGKYLYILDERLD